MTPREGPPEIRACRIHLPGSVPRREYSRSQTRYRRWSGVGGKVRAGTHRQGCRLCLLQSLWVDDRVACIRPAAEAFTCRVEKIRARAHGILRIINIGTRVQALTQFIAAVLGIFRLSTGIRKGESVQPHAVFVEVRECVITFGGEISRNIAPGDNAVFSLC